MKIMDVLSGLDIDQIEIEDQGFFEDQYEVEIYHDVYEWNAARTDRTGQVIWQGDTVSPVPYIDEDENLDINQFAAAIRRQVEKSLNDPERIGPVYVTA